MPHAALLLLLLLLTKSRLSASQFIAVASCVSFGWLLLLLFYYFLQVPTETMSN